MESTKITESLRKTRLRNEELSLLNQSFVIVPYLVSGYQDYTNRGLIQEQRFVNDYETFKRIWTGNDTVSICWKDSFKVVQNENGEMESQYQLGDFFLGIIETNNFSNNLERDTAFSDYIKQEQVNTITFRVHNIFEINDNYNFYLYKIPELSKSTLYRIEAIEKDFAVGTNELLGYVITFRTINQELATTGKAKQQNISTSAPGQGYLECEIKDQKWFNESGANLIENVDYIKTYGNRYVIANKDKFFNRPIVKANIKFLGASVPCVVAFVGRRVDSIDSSKWGAQELIFLKNIENDLTPTLFRTQQNQQNYFFGNFETTLSREKDFFSYLKDLFGSINKIDYNGWLTYDMENLKKTNPLDSDNKYENDLNKNWRFVCDRQKEFISGEYGVSSTINVSGAKTLDNHLFFNFWTQKDIAYLPTNQKETLGLKLAQWSIWESNPWGQMVNFFNGTTLSEVGKWFGIVKPKFRGICGFISAPFLEMNDDYWKDTLQAQLGNRIPMNFLENDKENPSSIFFRSDTINTSFSGMLTNRFMKNDIAYSTLELGQVQDKDGNYFFSNKQPLTISGNEELISPTALGFIIDKVLIQSIGKCDISIEFLDINNEIVWSSIFQSESKWTDSFREIWTIRDTSIYGRENTYFSKEVPYPKALSVVNLDISNVPTYQEHLVEIISKQWKNTTTQPIQLQNIQNWYVKDSSDWLDRSPNWGYSPYIFNENNKEVSGEFEIGGTLREYQLQNKVMILEFRQLLSVPSNLSWGYYTNNGVVKQQTINDRLDIQSFSLEISFNQFDLGITRDIRLTQITNNKIYEKDSIEIWNYQPLQFLEITLEERIVNNVKKLFLRYRMRLIYQHQPKVNLADWTKSEIPTNPRLLTFYKSTYDTLWLFPSQEYLDYTFYIKFRI